MVGVVMKFAKQGWSLGHVDGVLGPVWWVRRGRWVVSLYSPRTKALFSERNGIRVPKIKWRGWRLFVEENGK